MFQSRAPVVICMGTLIVLQEGEEVWTSKELDSRPLGDWAHFSVAMTAVAVTVATAVATMTTVVVVAVAVAGMTTMTGVTAAAGCGG